MEGNRNTESWGVRVIVGRLVAKAPLLIAGLSLLIACALAVWQFRQTGLNAPRETVSIGLTNEELVALRRLIKPSSPKTVRGTQVHISQVRDLEDRLTALEKSIGQLPNALSATASNDLKLIHKELENLKERVTFQGQLFKDQRAEFWEQLKWWTGIMVTLFLALLGSFWHLSKKEHSRKSV